MQNDKCMLIIMDGYGLTDKVEGNAIKEAKTPNLDKIFKTHQWTSIKCSGNAVGLPEGIMGNSEVGHLNIGAGRIVYQDITRIDKAIADNSFFENKALLKGVNHVKENDSTLHIFGLVSDGKVHSSLDHLWALLKLAKENGIKKVYLHAFMDGRDTSPHSGAGFIRQCEEKFKEIGVGEIATISGRYYAMDRDQRWDRTKKAYDAIVNGKGVEESYPVTAVKNSYDNEVTDEFILPTVIEKNGKPVATVNENDSIIFFNFRADRARQLTRSFVMPEFDKFDRKEFEDLVYVTMKEYDKKFNPYLNVVFEPFIMDNILGEVIKDNNLKQLRIAETEKYAHVTFFFNGGVEKAFENEDRILINSPKVATYDLQPEMSAYEVTDKVLDQIKSEKYELIVLNFANCDMVGHTGDFDAAVKAVETVDECMGKLIPFLQEYDYNYIITADHGNAEQMIAEDGSSFTAHTTNPVPFIISEVDGEKVELHETGKLADIAPTILDIFGIDPPDEFEGKSMIKDS